MPGDDFPVQVTIWVKSSHYPRLLKFADDRHTTVAQVLSDLVGRSLGFRKTRKKRVEVTAELRQEMVSMALNRIPQKDIAAKLNLSQATVSKRLQELGIHS